MIKTTPAYNKAFDQLNNAQEKAVKTTQGPVMVVAGPGTGKTSLLTTRIAYILQRQELQVGPENILCLTFTDAAAGNMRRRLVDMIGEPGARVGVYTYHAFANEALERIPRLSHLREEMEPASELESRRIVREILGEQPLESPLRKLHGRLYAEVSRMEELFQTIKTHYINPETGRPDANLLIEKAREQLKDLDNDASLFYKHGSKDGKRKTGDPKPTYFSTKSRLEKLIAAAGCFDRYVEKLEQAGLYDFADMINWVNTEFKENPDFLAEFQERYHYFLVDEYQDTNGSQNELLFSLLTPAFSEDNPRPNVLIVGDDDQGIYRFQGADIGNMEAFVSRYPELELVVLTENYRSSQPILDYASRVITGNA
ncbi:MAG: ATP-dependent helicase, partial [Bacteroidota bacterium]